jgi:hypothetical protein
VEVKHKRLTESLENKVITYLDRLQPKGTEDNVPNPEEAMAQAIVSAHSDGTIYDLMREGNLSSDLEAYDILCDIGIPLLVNIYCSRGINYDTSKIEDKLSKLGFKPITCYKLYYLLTKWRQTVEVANRVKTNTSTDLESTVDSQITFISNISP